MDLLDLFKIAIEEDSSLLELSLENAVLVLENNLEK
jgi:hypothetical protein